MNDEEFLQQLREAFAIEAEEHLQAMTAGLIELEKAPAPERQKATVEAIFRQAHSLKGAARAVNRTDIESICQALESVFAVWKREGASVSAHTFDVLSSAVDFVAQLRGQSDVSASVAQRNALQEIVRQVASLTAAEEALPAPPESSAPTAEPEPPTAPPPSASAPSATPPAPPVPASAEPERLNLAETVRVPLLKMDELLLQTEEMVRVKLVAAQHTVELHELGVTLGQWRKEWAKVRAASGTDAMSRGGAPGAKLRDFLEWNESQMDALEKRLTALAKVAERDERSIGLMVDDLLDDAKRLAMLPFARLLDLFPQQVRALSREQGKEVALVIRGSEVEIDKRILEEMKDPLIHLVRNAIDHGLEKPETRRQRGKPPQGLLTIAVTQHDGNKVHIVISDDGEGIDLAKVKASAVKNDTITEAEANQLREDEALALIFQSGVSTSPILTEISGRGLGMAIVREKVEKLGGQIAIETKPHAGTSFSIVLPVTLATFKGILVGAGGQTFVIPTSSVDRITRIRRDQIETVENRETIMCDERPLSLAWLADVLEMPRREPKEAQAFVEVVVLGAADQRVAFAVEAVLNEQEVLVKKLNKPLLRVRNVAGATVLGSGTAAVILNTADLLKSAIHLAGRRAASAAPSGEEQRVRDILVTDDSVTSRMLLKNILESAGYHVATAVDGVEALTALKSRHFDLLVSDVEMPRMDGFDLTTKVRADARLGELPVVLVTALSTREHQERGIDVGANAYIVKGSFDQSNLLEVVRKLL